MTQLVIILIYLGLLLGLGLSSRRLSRGTSSDYLLASHSIGPFLLLMSLFGTTMTAFALVGSSGEAYRMGIGVYGMLASSSGILHSLCFLLLGVKLWQYGQRYGYRTQVQYFRDRLESDSFGLLLFPVLVALVIPYLLIGVISAGAVISGVTKGEFPALFAANGGGVPPWLGSLVICLVVLCYVFFGGMRGTAWANAFQTIVFMVLGIISFYVIAKEIGGEETLLANLRKLGEAIPESKSTRTGMSKTLFVTYLLVPLSVGMFPHLFQHWLTARSAATFKLPVVAHPIFIMIVWVPCVLIGVWATTDMAGVPDSISANAVLAFLVSQNAGALLSGLLTAGILAAIMSSLDSQFLCLGTIFTNDVVLHYGGRERISDRAQVWLARGFIVLIVGITYVLSLQGYRRVFPMAVWCFSGFASLFPLVFASLYWKRLTAAGAAAGVLAMVVTWLYFFAESDFAGNPEYAVHLPGAGPEWEVMPVLPIFLASLVAMVLVSLVTRPPSDATLKKFFT